MTGSGHVRHWHVELLDRHVDRSAFACGVEALDRYLRQQASQDARRGFAAVYVVLGEDSRVLGYYSLSMAGVPIDRVPSELRSKMPRYPSVPAIRLGRLAVSLDARGRRLGEFLLIDALRRALRNEVAWAAFIVDAKGGSARGFSLDYGFLPFSDDPNHLFLPRATVERALARQ
ncbi:MAG: GNAT family N-acetyltransferase [Deltaproteobacteria bacterium]|nr:GNAT family N-acetyltransferase [Deltaproteobacteria bacterium]